MFTRIPVFLLQLAIRFLWCCFCTLQRTKEQFTDITWNDRTTTKNTIFLETKQAITIATILEMTLTIYTIIFFGDNTIIIIRQVDSYYYNYRPYSNITGCSGIVWVYFSRLDSSKILPKWIFLSIMLDHGIGKPLHITVTVLATFQRYQTERTSHN